MIPLVTFVGSLQKQLLLFRRYLLNTLSTIVIVYLAFVILTYIADQVGKGTNDAVSIKARIVAAAVVGVAAIQAYSRTALDVNRESQEGTLEQIALSPAGLTQVVFIQSVVNLLLYLGVGVLALVAMQLSIGEAVGTRTIAVVPLLFLSMWSAMGIGLAFSGLALVVKEIRDVLILFQYLFVGIAALPTLPHAVQMVLPLGSSRLMVEHVLYGAAVQPSGVVSIGSVLALGLNGIVYIGAGVWLLSICDRAARTRGILGHN